MPFGLGALNTRSAIETRTHTMENRVADYGDLAGNDETIDRFIKSQSIKRLVAEFYGIGVSSSMQYRNFSPRTKICFPTKANEALTASSNLLADTNRGGSVVGSVT